MASNATATFDRQIERFQTGRVIRAAHLNELVASANARMSITPQDEGELIPRTQESGGSIMTEVSRVEVTQRFENPTDPSIWVDVLVMTQVVLSDGAGTTLTLNFTDTS